MKCNGDKTTPMGYAFRIERISMWLRRHEAISFDALQESVKYSTIEQLLWGTSTVSIEEMCSELYRLYGAGRSLDGAVGLG